MDDKIRLLKPNQCISSKFHLGLILEFYNFTFTCLQCIHIHTSTNTLRWMRICARDTYYSYTLHTQDSKRLTYMNTIRSIEISKSMCVCVRLLFLASHRPKKIFGFISISPLLCLFYLFNCQPMGTILWTFVILLKVHSNIVRTFSFSLIAATYSLFDAFPYGQMKNGKERERKRIENNTTQQNACSEIKRAPFNEMGIFRYTLIQCTILNKKPTTHTMHIPNLYMGRSNRTMSTSTKNQTKIYRHKYKAKKCTP